MDDLDQGEHGSFSAWSTALVRARVLGESRPNQETGTRGLKNAQEARPNLRLSLVHARSLWRDSAIPSRVLAPAFREHWSRIFTQEEMVCRVERSTMRQCENDRNNPLEIVRDKVFGDDDDAHMILS